MNLKGRIINKPIYAFIIYEDDREIGYIQYYNRRDFPPEGGYDLTFLPKLCAGLDCFIGEADFINKGIGTKALTHFITLYVSEKFNYVFVDPDLANKRAIKAYKKAGFKEIPAKCLESVGMIKELACNSL